MLQEPSLTCSSDDEWILAGDAGGINFVGAWACVFVFILCVYEGDMKVVFLPMLTNSSVWPQLWQCPPRENHLWLLSFRVSRRPKKAPSKIKMLQVMNLPYYCATFRMCFEKQELANTWLCVPHSAKKTRLLE